MWDTEKELDVEADSLATFMCEPNGYWAGPSRAVG